MSLIDDLIASSSAGLAEKADQSAERDAELHAPPGLPGLPSGLAGLGPQGRALVTDLESAQHRELHDDEITLLQYERCLDEREDGGHPVLPGPERTAHVFPWELGAALGLVVIETLALADPIGSLQNLEPSDPERYLLPAFAAVVAGVLALLHGTHDLRRRRALAPRERRRESRASLAWASGILVIAGMGMVARAFSMSLDAQLDGSAAMDPNGLGFFALLQLVFVLGSVGVARLHSLRQHAAEVRAYEEGIAAVEDGVIELADRIDHAPERQADELERMLAGLSSAVGHYAHHLPEVHPDPEARTAWAHRLSGALLDGSLLRTLWPEWFSGDRGRRHGRRAAQDGGGAGAGAGGDDADADADGRPGPDGPHGDPHDAPLGAFLPPDEAPDDDPAAEPAPDEPDGDEPDPDLLDAILNPPPGHDRP